MTTYNTGNPIGSTSPKDLYDNAENLDEAVNTTVNEQWVDRLGVPRKTIYGIESEAERRISSAIAAAGYEFIGDYDEDGPLTITEPNQLFSKDGEYYRIKPGVTLPYTTTNWSTDEPNMVASGDASLRTQLAMSSPGGGAYLVTDGVLRAGSLAQLRLIPGRYNNDQALLSASYPGQGSFGYGMFTWDTGSTADDDDHNVIQVTGVANGRWMRRQRVVRDYRKNLVAKGVGESSSVGGGGWDYTKLDGTGVTSSVPGSNYAWGADATGSNYVDVRLPYGVVIGDSISEGRPTYNGRLTAGGIKYNYDPNLESQAGQPSYEIGARTGLYWYNHGIYGDTSTDVVNRWRRDVLSETFDPGDGIGNRTLPSGQLPYAVWVNVGINDNYNDNTKDDIKANYIYMVESAKENGILIIFNTIGPQGDGPGTPSYQKQVEINEFLRTEIASRGAYIFEYRKWFEATPDGSTINGSLAVDHIHPSPAGHITMAQEMLRQTNAPIVCDQLVFESRVDPLNTPPAWRQATRVTFYKTGYTEWDGEAVIKDGVGYSSGITYHNQHSSSLRVVVRANTDSPINPSNWTSISNIYVKTCPVGCQSSGQDEAYGVLICNSGVWSIDSTSPSLGVSGVSQGADNVSVNTTKPFQSISFVPAAVLGSNYSVGTGWSGQFPGTNTAAAYIREVATGSLIDPSTAPDNTRLIFRAKLS